MRLNFLAQVCPNLPDLIRKDMKYTNESIYDIIKEISPDVESIFLGCFPKRDKVPCLEAVAPVYTEEGLCFAFNTLNSYEIFTDE